MKAACIAGDHNKKDCSKHPASSELYKVALLHFQTWRRKLLSRPLRSAKLVPACPLTLFALKWNQLCKEKGVKNFPILSAGHDKDRFTMTLACLCDGTKLPPYVVFKRKRLLKNLNFSKEVGVRYQTKGWMAKHLCRTGYGQFGAKLVASAGESRCSSGIRSKRTYPNQFTVPWGASIQSAWWFLVAQPACFSLWMCPFTNP